MTGVNRTRRRLLTGGLVAGGGLLAAAWMRPSDQGKNHNDYFQGLSGALDRAELSGPTLVIDRQVLDSNIAKLKSHIS